MVCFACKAIVTTELGHTHREHSTHCCWRNISKVQCHCFSSCPCKPHRIHCIVPFLTRSRWTSETKLSQDLSETQLTDALSSRGCATLYLYLAALVLIFLLVLKAGVQAGCNARIRLIACLRTRSAPLEYWLDHHHGAA